MWQETSAIKTAPQSNLKKLVLTIAYHADHDMDLWNEAFDAIIKLCPNLNTLKLECDEFNDTENGKEFNLDLTGLGELKNIKLNLRNFKYYTFNQADKKGRCWIDYDNMYGSPLSESDEYHINLSWSGQPTLNLRKLCP